MSRRSRVERTPPETDPASDTSPVVSRRHLLASIGTAAVAAPLLAGAAMPSPAAAGKNDRAANALEFAGRLLQEGGRFTGFGYVTAARGIDPALLFFAGGAAPSEGTALLTFHTVSTLTSIVRVNGVFVARAAGTLRIYVRDSPGADFGDPSTFRVGTLVAQDEAEYQNTLTVTDLVNWSEGLANIVGSLTRTRAVKFSLGGDHHRIGSKGETSRLTAVGRGVLTVPSTPVASFDLGGYVTTVE